MTNVRRKRLPNPNSPEEVRRAFGLLNNDVDIAVDALDAFKILVAATYVPYTGAHTPVDLGVYNITTTGDAFINELTLTDDVNAVNGVFSGDVSCVNITMTGNISTVNYIDWNLTPTVSHQEGRMHWNADDGTIAIGMPGGSVELQVGQESIVRCRNTTGSTIVNGSVVYITGSSGNKPLIALSKADDKSTAIVFGVVTEDIDNNDNGYVTVMGLVRDMDTSGITAGSYAFLSDSTAGSLSPTPAEAPSYKARVGYCLVEHASNGVLLVDSSVVNTLRSLSDVNSSPAAAEGNVLVFQASDSTWSARNTQYDFWNGTFRETFDAMLSSSDGVNITLSVEQSGGGDLTMQFSDGETTFDCTPAATIAITPGTDSSPTPYMVYIPQATKVLTVGSSWPIGTEHIKVCFIFVPSATFVQDHGGGYTNQNWNDHLAGTDGQGHLAHACSKLRQQGADWYSGVSADGATASYFTIGAGSVTWQSTEGLVSQMHAHTFSAKDTSGTDVVPVVNDSVTPYVHTQNLHDIDADSTGTTITNNRYFNLVFWGVANKTGEPDFVMCNLPSGFYTLQSEAELDTNGYSDYSFPREFDTESSTAFLICRATFQMGSTWSHIQTIDLRSFVPGKSAGTSVNDHGALGGLADDDHTQYHNDTRGDVRYYTQTLLDAGQLDTRYFTEAEHLDASAGAGDSGKPIKLDANGLVDATMLEISEPSADNQVLQATGAGATAWTTDVEGLTSLEVDDIMIDGSIVDINGISLTRVGATRLYHSLAATGGGAIWDFFVSGSAGTENNYLAFWRRFGGGTNEGVILGWDNASNSYIYRTQASGAGPSHFPISLYAGATAGQLYLDTTGQVSIGSTSAETYSKLDVRGASATGKYGNQLHLHTSSNTYGMFAGSWEGGLGAIIQGGYVWTTSTNIMPRDTDVSGIRFVDGTIEFIADTGRAPGSFYTPTIAVTVNSSGMTVGGASVTSALIGQWNTAYGWGDHSTLYYTKTLLDAGQLDNRYFTEAEHINSTSGAGDAGKPIKLDAAGLIDSTMLSASFQLTQGTPTNHNTSATLTAAEIDTKIITSTPTGVMNLTLPTGTLMDTYFSGYGNDDAIEWSLIVLAAFAVTIVAGTAHTVVGNAKGALTSLDGSIRLLSRRTGTNTWVTYRIS